MTTPDTGPPPQDRRVLVALFALYIAALVIFSALEYPVLFAWPAGIVTGNLLASAIWAPLAVVHLDRLARRHHAEHLALLRRHHRDLKAHVTQTVTATAPAERLYDAGKDTSC